MRLVDSLHLQVETDGTARVVDDRTFAAAQVNHSARILLEALREPRTHRDLQSVLAQAAGCPLAETVTPVARLVEELTAYGWVENADTDGEFMR
ncbi:PqqD family peptide modification chaperone [Streptomyces sp. S3(2020)]|nr:PqqD family peptide modification chaperone [Streptomyces sp. S3(2020)]